MPIITIFMGIALRLYYTPTDKLLIFMAIFNGLYFGLPVLLSWRYDVTGLFKDDMIKIKEVVKKKQILWYFWIPMFGRLAIHDRDVLHTPNLDKAMIQKYTISLIENTLLYFIVGVIGSLQPIVADLRMYSIIVWILMVIIIPLEYLLTLRFPAKFMSDGDIDYVEYVCIFYHAFWFTVTGYYLGSLIL
jgi:hypothetical protein